MIQIRERGGLSMDVFKGLRESIKSLRYKKVNVYFISGMCYSCTVFDDIQLPKGYNKIYLEWTVPSFGESLVDYSHKMAEKIDTTSPFILVGYSFGGVIVQEMSFFLSPEKVILISSFKQEQEIPMLFRAAKRMNLADKIPLRVYASTDFITEVFNRFVYHMSTSELVDIMTFIDPYYIKWSVEQIVNWSPRSRCKSLYHIHGTEDQIFPCELVTNAFPVTGGDHLMILKKAGIISFILNGILLIKE